MSKLMYCYLQGWQAFARRWKKRFSVAKTGLTKTVFFRQKLHLLVFARIYFHQNKMYLFLFVCDWMNLVCRNLLLLNCLFTLLVVVFISSGVGHCCHCQWNLGHTKAEVCLFLVPLLWWIKIFKIPVCWTKIGVTGLRAQIQLQHTKNSVE